MGSLDQLSNLLKTRRKEDRSTPPLMDVAAVKRAMVQWLADVKLPRGSEADSWEELIQEFPRPKDEAAETTGVKIRLALRLFTAENTYLLSIMERLEPDSREIYLISVHVNWTMHEKQTQQMLEESYQGGFDDSLRPRHTLWAQTFRERELPEALASCFKALLAHELIAASGRVSDGDPVPLRPAAAFRVPNREAD